MIQRRALILKGMGGFTCYDCVRLQEVGVPDVKKEDVIINLTSSH